MARLRRTRSNVDNLPDNCPAGTRLPGRLSKTRKQRIDNRVYALESDLRENMPVSDRELDALTLLLGPDLKKFIGSA